MLLTPFPTTRTESGVSERSLLSADVNREFELDEDTLLSAEVPVLSFLRGGPVLVVSSSSRPRRTELALEEVAEVDVDAELEIDGLL